MRYTQKKLSMDKRSFFYPGHKLNVLGMSNVLPACEQLCLLLFLQKIVPVFKLWHIPQQGWVHIIAY